MITWNSKEPNQEPCSSVGTLQACQKAEQLTHRSLEIVFGQSDQPDWRTGTVTSAGPRPPA
ncbi:hypothetical protein SAMN05216267_11054 [Actinacidiphila rubida]|uniref:Uncharacterized protein n=1 Tax=Actinacidiphila rubida TaxID=310780 RepID=A0A1H8V455_9ACTN|nr:hypothetical protein [Actinacidiphila rubida]SEP10209.1 hypothetical protein SAMN05216267_11054 [Actinacidiphila rubida]